MSFVTLAGDGSTRPTFFELVAAERLMPSLKAAILYSLSVFAQRRAGLQRLLQYEDEVFAAISALLDRASLAAHSASFAESLYNLRRSPAEQSSSSAASPPRPQLSARQQRLTLTFLVAAPYVRAKLQALYSRQRAQADSASRGLHFPLSQGQHGPARQAQSAHLLHTVAMRLFLRIYPWLHFGHEALRFAYNLGYLLDMSQYYSPSLHLLGQHRARVSSQELVEGDRLKRAARRAALQRSRTKGGIMQQCLRRSALQAGYAVADHTRSVLILSVFAFKVLEWWFTRAEDKMKSGRALLPAPPPPPMRPSPGGLQLPQDVSVCGLCQLARTNPAMLIPSGYTFCYPCLYRYIQEHGCCPVTRVPATEDNIRRLYQSL